MSIRNRIARLDRVVPAPPAPAPPPARTPDCLCARSLWLDLRHDSGRAAFLAKAAAKIGAPWPPGPCPVCGLPARGAYDRVAGSLTEPEYMWLTEPLWR